MTRFLLTAACGAAFVLPGLAPAQAQSYGARSQPYERSTYEECVASQRNRQVAGAVIGGVLGAVIGAELHDGAQDRAREDRRYRRHNGYRSYGHRYPRHRGYRHRGYREQGQGGAVVAGAGVGALAGAALGGAGRDECARFSRRTGRGYGAAPGHYGSDAGYRGGDYGYDDRRYDDRRYETGGYDDGYGRGGDYGYDDGYGRSSGELLGGPDARRYDEGRDAQVYTAGSAAAPATGACRDMRSAGRLVRMCQGADGIWRPAETYR